MRRSYARLLARGDGVEERRRKAEQEWESLRKGSLSGLCFFMPFVEAADELWDLGDRKTEQQMLEAYLEKIGPERREQVSRDRRAWKWSRVPRRVRQWREAHQVLLELENPDVSRREGVARLEVDDPPWPSSECAEASGSPAWRTKEAKGAGPQDRRGRGSEVCFRARDRGECFRSGCPYDHSVEAVAAARVGRGLRAGGAQSEDPVCRSIWSPSWLMKGVPSQVQSLGLDGSRVVPPGTWARPGGWRDGSCDGGAW